MAHSNVVSLAAFRAGQEAAANVFALARVTTDGEQRQRLIETAIELQRKGRMPVGAERHSSEVIPISIHPEL